MLLHLLAGLEVLNLKCRCCGAELALKLLDAIEIDCRYYKKHVRLYAFYLLLCCP